MSSTTRPGNSSPLLSALQQIFSPLMLIAGRRASDETCAASGSVAANARKPMGFFKRLGQKFERREGERDEAYLAGSADIHDLEYRMRQLDRMHSSNLNQWSSNSRQY